MEEASLGPIRVIATDARLDSDSTPEFELTLHDRFNEGARHFVVDLIKLSYISSAGVQAILNFQRKLTAEKGSLRLCGMSANIRQAMQLSGAGIQLEIFRTREDALKMHPELLEQAEAVGDAAGKLLGAGNGELGGIPDPGARDMARQAAKLLGAPVNKEKPPAKATAFMPISGNPLDITDRSPPRTQTPAAIASNPSPTSTTSQDGLMLRIKKFFGYGRNQK